MVSKIVKTEPLKPFNMVKDTLKDPALLGKSFLTVPLPDESESKQKALYVTIDHCELEVFRSRAKELAGVLQANGIPVELNSLAAASTSFIVSIEVENAGSVTIFELHESSKPYKEVLALRVENIAEDVIEALFS